MAALGLALILSGTALLIHPPIRGLGKLGDLAVLGLLACLLLAFVPQFYWPTADWRLDAVESFGLELPSSLSVQPWISFEAWLMALAGFAWLYAALQWKINLPGRRCLFFCLSILLSVIAGAVVWGNLIGARFLGVGEAEAFSFFPSPSPDRQPPSLGGDCDLYLCDGGDASTQPHTPCGYTSECTLPRGPFLAWVPCLRLTLFCRQRALASDQYACPIMASAL